MKIQIKSVLKSNYHKFRCVDEGQIIFPIGNNLHLFELGKTQGQFLHLHKQNNHLYDFIVSPNGRYIYTAQNNNNGIEICSFNLQNQCKVIRLSDIPSYMPYDIIESIQLVTDQFESTIIYVITKSKSEACITLIDMFKQKIIAQGFITEYIQAVSCSQQTYQISICGRGLLKKFKMADGGWTIEEKLPKKLFNHQLFFHRWLPLGRCLVGNKSTIYLIEDQNILTTINICGDDDSIISIVKIPRGFIVFTQKGRVKLFTQEGEEGMYAQVQALNLPFQKNEKIHQVEFNKKTQQLFVFLNQGKFYYTKVEQTSATTTKQNYFNFEQLKVSYSPAMAGSVTCSSGQNYCLISSQQHIQLWDLGRCCQTLSLQANGTGGQKTIKSAAINPDGHSLCVGYSDRVRFYRILINKFKQFGEYPIKNVLHIQYSHGGQLVAFVYGKGINSCLAILHTLSLKQVMIIKLGYKPLQVIWNEHDDEIFVSGQETKVISVYQISTKTKRAFLQFDHQINFIRFDYSTSRLIVSTGNQIHVIESDQNSRNIIVPKIEHFDYIFPVEGSYIATDKKGGLYYSNTLDFQKSHYLRLFTNQSYHLVYKKGILLAYTSPDNLFMLKVKVNNEQTKPEVRDNVVLVERQEINKFFDKVKFLEGQLEQLQVTTGMKIEDQRKKYAEDVDSKSNKFKQEIEFLQKKLAQNQAERSKEQKKNAKIFDELEHGQVKNVNDLQKVYDMKIRLQKQKCMTLEQQKLQEKIKYENIIKNLETKHNSDIEKVRKEYSQKLSKEIKLMQSEKQRHLEYKKKIETKLINIEQQGQMTLFEVQMNKDSQIKNLFEKVNKLQRENDAKIIALHNMQQKYQELKQKLQHSEQKILKNERIVQQNVNKALILEREVQKKNKTIEEKNSVISQQLHQIDGLEKAKYVLSFRTTEVRKELEPKQSLIQKLKVQMFKLDEQYKSQVKKNFQLNQKLQKIEKINLNLKKENNDMKNKLKIKQRLHNDLCWEIFFMVNHTDQKQWVSSTVKIYQNYIQQQQSKIKAKGQKNQDSTSQEINRHLIHVEQSLHQVATGNEKMLKGKEQEVVRKMKENAELVYDLNIMRKKENQYQNEIKEKNIEISRLKRQLNEYSQIQKSTTRANTANTGGTRRLISKDQVNQNNSDWIDLSIKRQSQFLIPEKSRKGRVFSAHKTMFWRDDSRKQKSKFSDIARQLQSAKNTILRQDRMIEQLNQRLLGIPEQHFT